MSRRMTKKGTAVGERAVKDMRGYLKEYTVFRKLLEEEMSLEKGFGNPSLSPNRRRKSGDGVTSDAALRLRLFEIRRFILSHPVGDEKLFLFLRYIHGETMRSCSEKMGISERTAYRLHKRALESAARRKEALAEGGTEVKCYE